MAFSHPYPSNLQVILWFSIIFDVPHLSVRYYEAKLFRRDILLKNPISLSVEGQQ